MACWGLAAPAMMGVRYSGSPLRWLRSCSTVTSSWSGNKPGSTLPTVVDRLHRPRATSCRARVATIDLVTLATRNRSSGRAGRGFGVSRRTPEAPAQRLFGPTTSATAATPYSAVKTSSASCRRRSSRPSPGLPAAAWSDAGELWHRHCRGRNRHHQGHARCQGGRDHRRPTQCPISHGFRVLR